MHLEHEINDNFISPQFNQIDFKPVRVQGLRNCVKDYGSWLSKRPRGFGLRV